MPEDEANGTEVSDAMSENENEYDDTEHTHNPDDDDKMAEQGGNESTGEVKKKYDPKDPLRPRRKKARRACYACQRAHLTCGKSSLPCITESRLSGRRAGARGQQCANLGSSPGLAQTRSHQWDPGCQLLTISQVMRDLVNDVSNED